MDEKRKQTKSRLKDIKTKKEFLTLVENAKLTDDEKQIACMAFVGGQGYAFIADSLGYSERTVKRKMRHILNILT